MCNKTQCHILPPYILEKLAKRGNLSYKKTLNDTGRILARRRLALNNLLPRNKATEKEIVSYTIVKANMKNV